MSLPLPPMERPDNRQLVIEQVLDMAAEAGVDDVELIVALALHRRMTEAELRHVARRPHLRRLRPPRSAHPARRRGPGQPRPPGPHRPGRGRRDQQAGGRVRPAGLRQHQPGGHGRRAQERGHRPGQLPEPAPPPQPRDHAPQPVVHGPAPLGAALVQLAHGPAHRGDAGVKVFQIETTLNTDTFPRAFALPAEARVGVEGQGPAGLRGRVDRPRPGHRPRHAAQDLPLGAGRPTG